ncbi:protein POLR1D-like isoform X2 [Silurus meridionalis]|uniref:protein POLR1D-like isoform X2 n=1 Tax=Silurus meridionalis TaxID=175797 RepID=UPI001EECB894|nr:protein POLR1D-like isoform X2 [Silurus meridionalis]
MAVDNDELEKRAVEELLKEANRGRVRAETMGPAGWMKCPLQSTNKRFLVNTLRLCASEHRSGGCSPATRGAEDSREEGGRGSRDRSADRQDGYRKATKHKRESRHSHFQSSKSSSTSELESSGHTPHQARRTKRTRSRSPIRERLATKRFFH